jgi:hypothetical protein
MQTSSMASTTLAVKVSAEFARKYRQFCEEHCLQVGKFTEQALAEMMEDYHFGLKAQRVLSRSSGERIAHERAFKAPARRR